MVHDALGNPVGLDDPASLSALDDFILGFIRCEARAVNVLAAADTDHSAIVQASCAALHMFAESPQASVNAAPFLTRALANAARSSTREQGFLACVAAWVRGDLTLASLLHEQHQRQFPRDLVALKLGQYHLFNCGDAASMLRLALLALPAASDIPQVHGMAAFAWEQCHLLAPAEAAARTGLEMCATDPWAQHALAHVMLTQGRLQEGWQFMQQASTGWSGLNSFMVTHNWWHLALFALELGEPEAVLELYDRQVWGVEPGYSQDQIGAVSLLARLELAGVDVGTRWQAVAEYLVQRVHDHVLPFLDLQYLYGLARAGRPEANTMLGSIEAYCQGMAPARAGHHAQSPVEAVWPRVCLPAARALLAHAQGRTGDVLDDLEIALARLPTIGGSHAQRDLFNQIYLDALQRAGNWAAAQQILQPQCDAQPQSLRLRRQARRAYQELGLALVQP